MAAEASRSAPSRIHENISAPLDMPCLRATLRPTPRHSAPVRATPISGRPSLNAGPGLREMAPTFGPLVKAWRAVAASYSDDELRLLLDFQQRLEDIVRGQLDRLRGEAAEARSGRE